MTRLTAALIATLGIFCSYEARAEMVLSQVIIDLQADAPPRDDIEVFNNGTERLYVAAEPFMIRNPGMSDEQRVPASRPDQSGLIVSPQRLVLAPGERRIIRIAAFGPRSESDRVYRVAIKPVTGALVSDQSALKVLVGYDTLVIVRPEKLMRSIVGQRVGRTLVIRNAGNTTQELFDGIQCDSEGKTCQSLTAKRLYPGARWEQTLPFETPVKYRTAIGSAVSDWAFE